MIAAITTRCPECHGDRGTCAGCGGTGIVDWQNVSRDATGRAIVKPSDSRVPGNPRARRLSRS